MSCRGHRHRALIVRRSFANETWRWQRSGHRLQAAHSVADASGPRRAEAAKAGAGMVRWNRRKGQTKLALGMVRWGRWKGQTRLAQGIVRWNRWKGQTKLTHGMVRWTDGRIKASWPRAWSVAPMEESNQAGARHGALGPMEGQTQAGTDLVRWIDRKGQTARSLGSGRSSGALTRSGSREFKGRPRDARTIGSVQPRLPFPRSIDKVPTGDGVFTRPQPQAPNLLGATGTGQHAALAGP